MIINLSLRARFIGACLLLVTLTTAGYYVAVAQFVEFLEAELRDITLLGELGQFVHEYERDPAASGPRSSALRSYVLPPGGDPAQLPERLRELAPGVHDDIRLDGREVAVARQDVDGARLLVALDMEPIEALEAHFVKLAWVWVLLSWSAAVLLALWLARKVMQPVAALAARVGEWQPGDFSRRLSGSFSQRDLGVIAAAFDRFIERLDAFVSRERAFTEDASHELRTPLSVIDSAAQLLADNPQLPPAERERVERILRATRQMRTLIESLLFLAREGGGAQAVEQTDLQALVAEAVDSHRELIASKNLDVAIRSVPVQVQAPHGMAGSVIGNLLINAIHYTDHGHIDLRLQPGRFSIEDSGIGIPPEDLDRVFERRFRGPRSRGLGLGLYLVKRICDRLGWRIRIGSSATGGTRVDIEFPAC